MRALESEGVNDVYASGIFRWWHLSRPSPELVAAEDDGWLGTPGVVIDLGCGLGTEVRYLASKGWTALGLDLSTRALTNAAARGTEAWFVRADALVAPVRDRTVDLVLDRGCFHYLAAELRPAYAAEAARVLRPGGRLFLRACLNAAGERNDIEVGTLRGVFEGWGVSCIAEAQLASDTRLMPALLCRLQTPTI